MASESAARRRIVVDGSNLATEARTLPSLAQLNEAIETFLEEYKGFTADDVTVVVDASFGHRIDPSELPEFEAAIEHGEMVTPPAGAVGRGDGFILRIAEKSGALVLSNDSFQEFHAERPWLFEPGRLIGGKPVPGVGWVFTPRTPVRGPRSRSVTAQSRREAKAAEAAAAQGDDVVETGEEAPAVHAPSRRRRSGRSGAPVTDPTPVDTVDPADTYEGEEGNGSDRIPAPTPTKAVKATKKAAKATKATTKATKKAAAADAAPAKKATKSTKKSAAAVSDAADAAPAKKATKAVKAAPTKKAAPVKKAAKAVKAPKATTATKKAAKAAPADTPPPTRERDGGPVEALNDSMTFITFVAAHPIGSVMEGEVTSFTSHGAHVDVGGMLCHVPLRGLGDPPPAKARSVVAKGEIRTFELVSLDAARRRAELTLPGIGQHTVS